MTDALLAVATGLGTFLTTFLSLRAALTFKGPRNARIEILKSARNDAEALSSPANPKLVKALNAEILRLQRKQVHFAVGFAPAIAISVGTLSWLAICLAFAVGAGSSFQNTAANMVLGISIAVFAVFWVWVFRWGRKLKGTELLEDNLWDSPRAQR